MNHLILVVWAIALGFSCVALVAVTCVHAGARADRRDEQERQRVRSIRAQQDLNSSPGG